DIHAKTKVVRAPARKPAGGGKLAPLIAGVIERRRQARRQNTAEFPGPNGVPDSAVGTDRPNTPVPPQSGFDKVKLRGGGVPERRMGGGHGGLAGSGYGTPKRDTSPGPSSSRTRDLGAVEERTPLLANAGKKNFARATRSVSLVPVAYYADIVAGKARSYVSDDDTSTQATGARAPQLDPTAIQRKLDRQFKGHKAAMGAGMWWM
ncbi:hypothetical protein JCM10207_001990, partial [Rhodosporidiobolus poonsookiae]